MPGLSWFRNCQVLFLIDIERVRARERISDGGAFITPAFTWVPLANVCTTIAELPPGQEAQIVIDNMELSLTAVEKTSLYALVLVAQV